MAGNPLFGVRIEESSLERCVLCRAKVEGLLDDAVDVPQRGWQLTREAIEAGVVPLCRTHIDALRVTIARGNP